MICYSNPYEGSQDFIFFSYCHDDAPTVYPMIERLSVEGFRVWYDNGIHPGDDWPEVIAEHLSRAKVCVAAISRASAESHNCRNEVSFAVANNKPFVSVVIEDFPMPLGMQLQLSSSNYIKKPDYSQEKFYQLLLGAPTLAPCRQSGGAASPAALRVWQEHVKEYQRPAGSAEPQRQAVDQSWFEERERRETEKAAQDKKREEEARLRAERERQEKEAEAKRRAEEEARLRAEQERQEKEAEAKRRAEEEARRQAEQERLAKEAEAKRRAEEEARLRAERERQVKEAEEKRRAEEEARLRAERERQAKEAEAKRRAEEEARLRAERERQEKEAEAKRRAEEEARLRAEQERLSKAAEEEKQAGKVRLTKEVNLRKEEPEHDEEPEDASDDDPTVLGDKAKAAALIRIRTGEIYPLNKPINSIGRSKNAEIVLTGNSAISKMHAEIIRYPTYYAIRDVGSTFGTVVDGEMLAQGPKLRLEDCAEIQLANEQLFFACGAALDEIRADHCLRVLKSCSTGELRLLSERTLKLDRTHKWKDNVLGDLSISRNQHAEVFRRGNRTILRDTGSRNGTFLNQRRLAVGEEAELKDGDLISVVETEFIYCESSIG